MEIVKPIKVPVIADSVLSPNFFYGDCTGIYFTTSPGDKYGRITFEKLDAVKICRGEMMPYEFDYSSAERGTWVYQIENSKWQRERFNYENKHYGMSYEFGGDVNEMLSDFKHYLFSFHDQFIEAIVLGFWFEEANQSLFGKELTEGHPFLPLPMDNMEIMIAHSLKAQIRKNPTSTAELIHDAQFCSQKLFEFALELEGEARVSSAVLLSCRNGQITSTLRSYFGREEAKWDGLVSIEQVKPFIEKYMKEVYERGVSMGKQIP